MGLALEFDRPRGHRPAGRLLSSALIGGLIWFAFSMIQFNRVMISNPRGMISIVKSLPSSQIVTPSAWQGIVPLRAVNVLSWIGS
jgi:hypothetical protein